MIIAITGFRPKNLLLKFRFLSHAVPLFQLAQKSAGNIHAERFTHQGYYHTITAWESRDAMMEYVYSPAHQKAIDLYDVLGEGLTCHYQSEEIPSSKDALDYWRANGQ
jgi:quinol monooxygenase YgiN